MQAMRIQKNTRGFKKQRNRNIQSEKKCYYDSMQKKNLYRKYPPKYAIINNVLSIESVSN